MRMKLRMKSDGRVYPGTAQEIVQLFREEAHGLFVSKNLDDYMKQVFGPHGFDDKAPEGKTLPERCQAFIDYLVTKDLAQVKLGI